MMPLMASADETAYTDVDGCTLRHDFGEDFTGFRCLDSGDLCPFSDTNITLVDGTVASTTCGACCLLDTIYTITDWIFILVGALVIIMILLGGYNLITAAGEPDKITKGKNYVLWAAIGFVVALASKSIPALARAIIGA
ncbi:hypothetical protein KAR26_00035 [Candidatus Parcubacteria bacterium]|nr:hypothetical protein [Candidatus Parcubacteria bacterium]